MPTKNAGTPEGIDTQAHWLVIVVGVGIARANDLQAGAGGSRRISCPGRPKVGTMVSLPQKQKFGLAAATAFVAALLVGSGAQAALPPPAGADGSAVAAMPTRVQVRLVTGDVVTLSTTPDGRQTAAVAPAHKQGPGGRFQTFTKGGDQYVVPESAMPYIGTTLDLRLFDVTRLAQLRASSLSLQVRLRTPTTAPTVAGIRLSQRHGLVAQGTLSPAAARAFGAALARQAARDHGSTTHTTGLFSLIGRLTPAASWTATAPARPDYPMHTLKIEAKDWTGAPDNGDSATLYNVDDLTRYSGFVFFQNGAAKVSVPSGHYALSAFFYDFNGDRILQTTVPQFTVTGDGRVSVDARDATSKVSIKTPRPATPAVTEMTVGRSDALGQVGSYGFLAGGTTTFYVEPTKGRVSVGQLHYYVYSRLFSRGAKTPYTYDLKLPSDGAIAVNQHYVVSTDQLATVHSSYAASRPDQASLDARFGALPWESFLFAEDLELTTPTRRTEYYTARPDLRWSGLFFSVFDSRQFNLLGEIDSAWRAYQPGVQLSTSWGRQPIHPRLPEAPIFFLDKTLCPACVSPTKMTVLAFPFGDSSPEHIGYPDYPTAGLTESATWAVSADGLVLKQGKGVFFTSAPTPYGAQVYTLSYDTVRKSADFSRSTAVRTTWKVKANAPRGALPDGWVCDFRGRRNCTVLPLMTSDYNLPVDMLGRIPSGTTHASVSIGHLPGAAGVPVTSLTAKVSFDGQHTWTKVRATDQGLGVYRLAFTVPQRSRTDGFASLSISARDANGSSISEMITRAFAVSAS